MLAQIEQAFRDNNHKYVKQCLDAIDSDEIKKKAFLRVIDYYENEEARFPVGYVVLFIKWLLESGDVSEAGNYIEKLDSMGIEKERISDLIYELVIKPDESTYENRFRQNLELLVQGGMLFSKHTFDFHSIKKKINSLKSSQTYPEKITNLLHQGKASFMLVDLFDMEIIKRLLELDNLLYLVYDDINKFYYMLLFNDLLPLSKYINTIADEAENIVIFAGREMDNIRDFFNNGLAIVPHYVVVQNEHEEYKDIIKDIENQRSIKLSFYNEVLKAYYKNKDYGYYHNLFRKEPSEIKVLIITSQRTTLNKYISRNWYDSFTELGYKTKIITENEPYERLSKIYVFEILCSFQPDVVFWINFAINSLSEEHEITDHLLCIMRHRDAHRINSGWYKYQNENMFVLPVFREFEDASRKANIPEDRIYYMIEGVDTNLFKKRGTTIDKYACDVVSVNNGVGNGFSRLELYLQQIENEITDEINRKALQKTMRETYDRMQEMALNDQFLKKDEFIELSNEIMMENGFAVTDTGRKFFLDFYSATINTFYRKRVVEWIVDSNITNNIKVWGMGWPNIPNLRKYHMGVAGHGRELSEIYEGSKISLCDTWGWNTHERNYEILASGGFPLVKSLSPEEQETTDNITNYFKENKEIVLFYDKEDLLNKVQYYLDHPEERERIAENGRKVVIENISNLAITRNTMEFIKEYYKSSLK